jgi:hypothetical protein
MPPLDGHRIFAHPFASLGGMESGVAIKQVAKQFSDLNRSSSSNLATPITQS